MSHSSCAEWLIPTVLSNCKTTSTQVNSKPVAFVNCPNLAAARVCCLCVTSRRSNKPRRVSARLLTCPFDWVSKSQHSILELLPAVRTRVRGAAKARKSRKSLANTPRSQAPTPVLRRFLVVCMFFLRLAFRMDESDTRNRSHCGVSF